MRASEITRLKRNFVLLSLGPVIVALILITVLPFVMNLSNSLHYYELSDPLGYRFIGLANYKNAVLDKDFQYSLMITFLFMGVVISAEFFLGFGAAILMSRRSRGQRALVTMALLPFILTPIATSYLWRIMYNPSVGVFDYFLRVLHLPESIWIADPRCALLAVALVDIWQWSPFMMLILLAGLLALPKEPFEAARVDGAHCWQIFTRITFPLMAPISGSAVLLRIIDSFKTFDIIFVLTRGGPGRATEVLNIHTYLAGFNYLRMGYASALAIIMLILLIAISMILVRRLRL